MEHKESGSEICKSVPNLLSSFVDVFVDFSVSGLFLPPNPNPNPERTPQATINEGLASITPLQTRYPTQDRLIAIGDLHGDLQKSKEAFRLAGLIDGSDRWAGGTSTVVQIGDVLDRGGDELKIFYFLEKLKREAATTGGKLITMNGNHEIMNVEADFRFVSREGMDEFRVWADWYRLGNKIKSLCQGLDKPKDLFHGIPFGFRNVKEDCVDGIRARIAALRPDGPIANRFLSDNVTVLVVGDSVFVHGGLLAQHVDYGLERINQEVRDWINGLTGRNAPIYCCGRNAVVWLRKFSDEVATNCDCSALEHVLATIPGAKRMIMGHTIQSEGISSACDNQAIRIDVGMSKGCGDGLPEVLEIKSNSELLVLTSNPAYRTKHKSYLSADRREGLGVLLPERGPQQVEVKA